MHIVGVKIENLKGFGAGKYGVDDIDLRRPGGRLAGWTVVAGRNGSGKSTFLRAIALAVAGPAAARSLQESFAGWVRYGQKGGSVFATVAYHDNSDRFTTGGRLPKKFFVVGIGWSGAEGEPSITSVAAPRRTALRGPWADNPEGWFTAGYGPFRRLTGHASDAQRLMVGPKRVARLVSLFREDASLVESVQWLRDIAFRKLEQKSGAATLESSVINLLGDGLLPEGMTIEKVDSDGLWVKQLTVVLALRELSDGYRTMAALVLDIVKNLFECYGHFQVTQQNGRWVCDYPGVVLIDEIDVHLHVSWQKRVGFWLKEHFPNIQFIVTTHSPFICQAADERGLIRLPAPGEQRGADHVSKDVYNAVVNGGADEAVMTELFGVEEPYSEPSKQLRNQVADLEAKIVTGHATDQEKRKLQQLTLALPKSQTELVERVLNSLEKAQ